MTGILAIDTATDACSIALWRNGELEQRFALTPRQHSQHVFSQLRDLLPNGQLREQGIDALAWGCGPGSFTGLRIAASAIQGLAFSANLPVLSVSTLACQVSSAIREGLVAEGDWVCSTLDARIKEIYAGLYRVENGIPVRVEAELACKPSQFELAAQSSPITLVGSGAAFYGEFSNAARAVIGNVHSELLPKAEDLLPLALQMLADGETVVASQVQPVYVRDEINWKKLPEQGKQK